MDALYLAAGLVLVTLGILQVVGWAILACRWIEGLAR